MAVVVADFLPDVRYWLRNHPDLQPLHAGRVFFRIPDVPHFPLLRLYELGGGINQTGTEAAIATRRISIEVWHNQDKFYDVVRQLAVAVESAVWQLDAGTLLNPSGQTRVLHAAAANTIDSPDPDTGWPRKIIDTAFTLQPL